jgi:hypothetical protein
MLGFKKKGPSQPTGPFAHADGCTLAKSDPDFEPEWQEVEKATGFGSANAGPKTSTSNAPILVRGSTRSTRRRFRHFPACEDRDTTDLKIVRAILTVSSVRTTGT